jgi:hypothetical protein
MLKCNKCGIVRKEVEEKILKNLKEMENDEKCVTFKNVKEMEEYFKNL